MPAKSPDFSPEYLLGTPTGVIKTEDPVQMGCVMCLRDGLEAPAEGHQVYLYQGTSYCSSHLAPFLVPQEPNA